MIAHARESSEMAAVSDKVSTPTYTRDIAEMLMPIVVGNASRETESEKAEVNAPGYSGILHIANSGQCSWQEYAQHALNCCREAGIRLKASKVGALKMSDMKNWVARRPVHSVLSTRKYERLAGKPPRSWRDAVAEYIRDFVR
jgi:dTDP-4-dehydrorhamnose reductase